MRMQGYEMVNRYINHKEQTETFTFRRLKDGKHFVVRMRKTNKG